MHSYIHHFDFKQKQTLLHLLFVNYRCFSLRKLPSKITTIAVAIFWQQNQHTETYTHTSPAYTPTRTCGSCAGWLLHLHILTICLQLPYQIAAISSFGRLNANMSLMSADATVLHLATMLFVWFRLCCITFLCFVTPYLYAQRNAYKGF